MLQQAPYFNNYWATCTALSIPSHRLSFLPHNTKSSSLGLRSEFYLSLKRHEDIKDIRSKKLTRYPNSMVESRAWMMDHKPQKKWDAKENLYSKICGHCLFPKSFNNYRLVLFSPENSPVDFHVERLLHFQLVPCIQVIKSWIRCT